MEDRQTGEGRTESGSHMLVTRGSAALDQTGSPLTYSDTVSTVEGNSREKGVRRGAGALTTQSVIGGDFTLTQD